MLRKLIKGCEAYKGMKCGSLVVGTNEQKGELMFAVYGVGRPIWATKQLGVFCLLIDGRFTTNYDTCNYMAFLPRRDPR